MSRSRFGFRVWLLPALCLVLASAASAKKPQKPVEEEAGWDDKVFAGLEWRLVGPYRGGRSAAVTGLAAQPDVYYFGSAGGGVWKTTDGGASWENVSDGFFGGSIGAVAVSEWDPNVVYVGGGEKTVRGNVSHGDGVWKSTDAGKTWTRAGLPDSRRIPRIRIHPRDPDLVYAAVLGHLFGPNEERGVFRSKDGGATWERILFVNASAGAVDLAMDPTNPRVLYASIWRVLRTPYSLESGGAGSGLWKSTDGGDSWTELTANDGLPEGVWGISGITVSPSNPQNLYAVIEAKEGGVFRSTDAGETWGKVNDERKLRQRAWYYTRIQADPADEDSVYVLNVRFHRSKDGGKTFEEIGVPHGDNHDLWIAPDDPLRMVQSNDGGANVSFDGGETWSAQTNQPTAQFYRVSTDNDFPYRLLGGQQDNSAVRIRSRSAFGGSIGLRDWEPTAGGESGHIVAHPDEPDIVYGGSYDGFLIRVDHRTGELRSVDVWPDNPMGWGAAELEYRFQWNFPIFFSPHDASVLYAAANVLFKTTDEGASWQAVSPDLTRNDKSTQGSSGGPITQDNTSVEYYGTIFAAAESPLQEGVLWAGSDDGLVHLSRDGGENWENVTPPELPEWTMINSLEPHPTLASGLYLAGTRYKLDDFRPYLYKTTDWGKTWTRIDSGIGEDHFTRVVRADPARAGLLYAGTERGVYVSFDDGASWRSLQRNLPVVPITDLAVKEGDLVAATQGRSFWILDNLAPLHGLSDEAVAAPFHLFPPAPAWRLGAGRGSRTPRFAGANPPAGAIVDFLLDDLPEETAVSLEFADAAGAVIRRFEGKVAFEEDEKKAKEGLPADDAESREPGEGEEADESEKPAAEDDPLVGKLELEPGLNRFAWDLRAAAAEEFEGMILWAGDTDGPVVPPGAYTVTLKVGEESVSAGFELRKDPRSSASQADLEEQYAFLTGIRDKLTEVHGAIKDIRRVRTQLGALEERLGDDESAAGIRESTKALEEAMGEIEKALYQTQNQSPQDPLNFPVRLNDKLGGVASLASIGDAAPTSQSYAVRDELLAAIDAELAGLRRLWTQDLPALNEKVLAAAVPAISLEKPAAATGVAARAEVLAHETLLVDTHVDVPYRLDEEMEDISVRTAQGDFDYPRAVAGGLDAPFMSIYVPSALEEDGAYELAEELIDMVEGFERRWPDKFAVARSVADVRAHFERGLISLPMGMENGAPIEGDLDNLRHFAERGVCYITLTHAENNHICDSSYATEKTWNGLSPFGREVVAEMNRLGVMIDVSHVSDEAFFQILELTRAPVIASHSSCRHFTPGWERNLSDEMIVALAGNGGVVQINFGSAFLTREANEQSQAFFAAARAYAEENGLERGDPEMEAFGTSWWDEHPRQYADLADVVAHVDHVVELVGVDHVGFGSDFDGVGDSLPVGLKDVSQYPNLIAALLEAGYSEEDVAKMASGNLLRVWEEVERVAGADV